MLEKAAWFSSLGSDVEKLDNDKEDPGDFAIDQGQGQGEQEDDQFIYFKPEHLKRFGQVLGKIFAESVCHIFKTLSALLTYP